jgi:hypothetical protein
MAIDFGFFLQSVREGHWALVPALVLSVGLSCAFGILVFQLLDVRFLAVPDRFPVESPETAPEQVWKDFVAGFSFLFQGTVRILLSVLGFCGVILSCLAVINLLSGGIFVNVINATAEYRWYEPLVGGAILGLPPLAFAWYTHANDLRKWQTVPMESPPETAALTAYAAGSSRMPARYAELFQFGIAWGLAGWMVLGLWILLASGWYGLQAVGWSLFSGRMIPPSSLLLLGMPTAVGWLLILAGGFLFFFFRTAFTGKTIGSSLQQYLSFRTITMLAASALIGTAIVYHPWPNPLKSVAVAILFFILLYFQLSAIGPVNVWTKAFAVLFGTYLGMNGLHGIGFRIGILPFFFVLAFLYRIYPEWLRLLRERRHGGKPALRE